MPELLVLAVKKRCSQSLVIFLALHLALPVGWCCYVPALVAAAWPKSQSVAAETETSCCCCKKAKTDSEKSPAKPAAPTPRKCCCEPLPSQQSPKAEWELPILADALQVMVVVNPRSPAVGVSSTVPPFLSISPHLLFCVWTC